MYFSRREVVRQESFLGNLSCGDLLLDVLLQASQFDVVLLGCGGCPAEARATNDAASYRGSR